MKKIRESKFSKIVAYYLIIMMCLQLTQPMQMYALTGGPAQPEFNSFTPIGTSDMVDLSTGDFNYNIPIMDVGGYPLNLAYNSGISMDQEASWVGLGWDLGVGQISRQVRGLPDDFNGDKMVYENYMKPNVTIGSNFNVFLAPYGTNETGKLRVSFGIGVKYNNYDGYGFSTEAGLTYSSAGNTTVGLNLESSSTDGVSVSPSVSFSNKRGDSQDKSHNLSANLGVSLNSRKGLESLSFSTSYSNVKNKANRFCTGGYNNTYSAGTSGSISFVDASFTPAKRVGMSSSNFMSSFNFEAEIFGVNPGFKISGYRTSQGVKDSEKYKIERGFGYENTQNASLSDILDFNREKDRVVNKNTRSLPVTNYTYDLYSIQGQGIGGMFRPYRSQVGFVFDNYTRDDSNGGSLSGEVGGGNGVHVGGDITVTTANSSTGIWDSGNLSVNRVKEKNSGNKPNYEKVFFKNIGGNHVDQDMDTVFNNQMGGYDPITFKISDNNKFNRTSSFKYYNKFLNATLPVGSEPYIKRGDKRLNRNQTIEKLNVLESYNYGTKLISPYVNRKTQKHHTAEVRIIKDGGERYNYGRALYNSIKKEVTFDVSNKSNPLAGIDCKTGLVSYIPDFDNTPRNQKDGDRYFNRITTPGYAHSYLLTSVLSSDYQDIDGKSGPTDGDLGTYTKFTYTNKSIDANGKKDPYKWRMPYQENMANLDEGLRSLNKDNKGNYQYGEKELLYINKIETKTHIAIFTLSERKDGVGVKGENGGADIVSKSAKMWKLDKISLYSKPEYLANPETAIPIKVAHFEYNYALCDGVLNNVNYGKTGSEYTNQRGKLTLKKVYFTYRNSNMGKYTPYEFDYQENKILNNGLSNPENIVNNDVTNPLYNQKAYDVWGNYKKPNENVGCGTRDGLSNTEYPFVDQSDREEADLNQSVWLLRTISLPSGGKMELKYESDDYRYVQDKEVMQMFKVAGAGTSSEVGTESGLTEKLYGSQGEVDELGQPYKAYQYLYIKIDKQMSDADFKKQYIDKLKGQLVYFRFLLNMTNPNGIGDKDKYDYVTGYMEIDQNAHVFSITQGGNVEHYASIKIAKVSKGDKLSENEKTTNPISKAGWYFGRQYLNNVVYSLTGEEDVNNLKGVIAKIVNLVPQMLTIFKNVNTQLQEKYIAQRFIKDKSWIRLMQPDSKKLGGGSRVKEIQIKDEWDAMTDHKGQEVYKQFYGQQYSYTDENGNSSGIATYEPLGSKENPFVYPFFDESSRDNVLAPDSQNYVELPFGESFFPNPKITYSRVTVNNLPRSKTSAADGVITVKKHATGKVVTEFFTTKDYPTISDKSMISSKYDNSPLAGLLNINVKTHLTFSQGFSVHTNDMDGKMKSQWVYGEDQKEPISGMEYKYEQLNVGQANQGKLNNEVVTINEQGKIAKSFVGVDYDVINDFSENYSDSVTKGVHFNLEQFIIGAFLVLIPIPIPNYSKHVTILRKAVTTKNIHTTAILRETIAHDLGSQVSTKNLAWDSHTGEVLVTETVNEYNDKYYSFNFPAYWANKGMDQAALNSGLETNIKNVVGTKEYEFTKTTDNASKYLIDGDELWIKSTTTPINRTGFKAWVVGMKSTGRFSLIDEKGIKIIGEATNASEQRVVKNGSIKVIRSGHRNMQMASMASVTLMKNPLYQYVNNVMTSNFNTPIYGNIADVNGKYSPFLTTQWDQNRIINASAIEYKEEWPSQCNCGLPKMVYEDGKLKFEYNQNSTDDYDLVRDRSYNPYRFNILGNWRAVKSYAYLTGRNVTADPTPRKTGFFKDFKSLYVFNTTSKKWEVTVGDDFERWTFASEVSKYNPYGQEAENKDALNRYSAALYGYNYRFPTAVASNAKYSEIAYDGFEDYDFSDCNEQAHFSFEEALKENRVTISNKQAHTGRKSIRLEPKEEVFIAKKVINCDNVITPGDTAAKKKIANKIITKRSAK